MLLNFRSNYSHKNLDRINNRCNKNVPNINQTSDLASENYSNIFSPINNNNSKILELSSLNDYHTAINSPSKVKVKKLPSHKSENIIPINSRKKTLVLDLDETLVHSTTKSAFPNKKNIILHMKIKNINYTIYVILRPYLEAFLNEMSLCYDLYIFTASVSQYAKNLIGIIDKNKVIKQVLNRENCKFIKGLYLKDLSIFKRDLKDIIIIDNNPLSYTLNKNNGIPISTWIDDSNDKELLRLIPIMKFLSKARDVRPIINKIVNKLKKQIDFIKINKILDNNYKIKYNLPQPIITKIENKSKNQIDFNKLNKISDNNNKTKYRLSQRIKINNDEVINLKKESLKINKNFKIKKELSFNNNGKIKKFQQSKNDIINKDKINKEKIIDKNISEKNFNKFKEISRKDKEIIIPLQINIKSSDKVKMIFINKKKTEIYNISIGNINNIQKKINIFNDSSSNQNNKELDNSINNKNNYVKKTKRNDNSSLAMNKKEYYFTKKIKFNLFEDIKTQINKMNKKNITKSVNNNNIKTEINESPKDRIKIKLNKNIFFDNKMINNKTICDNIESNELLQKNINSFYGDKKRITLNLE